MSYVLCADQPGATPKDLPPVLARLAVAEGARRVNAREDLAAAKPDAITPAG